MKRNVYDFGTTVVDLDKVVMVKSYSDDTIAITFVGSDNPKRFGPLGDKEYQEFMDAWIGVKEE